MRHLLRHSQRPHEVGEIVGQGVKLEPDGVVAELGAGLASSAPDQQLRMVADVSRSLRRPRARNNVSFAVRPGEL